MSKDLTALLDQWQLEADGEAQQHRCLVQPVRTVDGRAAVLKVGPDDGWHSGSIAALKAWGGAGTVEVLRAAPAKGAVLLEPLEPAWLGEEPGDLADFWPVLHRPAPAALPRLDDLVADRLAAARAQGRRVMPPQLVQQAGNLAQKLAADARRPVALHGALVPEHVMARRDGLVAIAPLGLAGDENAEGAAWLCSREGSGSMLQEDFFSLVDALLERGVEVDEHRVRDWTMVLAVLAGLATDDEARRSQLVQVARAIGSVQVA